MSAVPRLALPEGLSQSQARAFRVLEKVGKLSTPVYHVGEQLHRHQFRSRVSFEKLVEKGIATREVAGRDLDRYETFRLAEPYASEREKLRG